jgi:predicted nucleotidyltransferase component of viral defense system
MNSILENMLRKYPSQSLGDFENALKEIIQEIALLGLYRAKFYEHAAFYGGTALRILYGLDRFSEDLDFSLLKSDKEFSLEPYLQAITDEIKGVGLEVTVSEKFIKAGTLNNLIEVDIPKKMISSLHRNQQLKIKLEIDTNPPLDFETQAKYLLQPIPFTILTFQLPDLFAGKIHAMLFRQWKTRIKGRDWYDFVWFVGQQVPIRLAHLKARLLQGNQWDSEKTLSPNQVNELLINKILTLDVAQAKQDVFPFLRDAQAIDAWSKDFFLELIGKLKYV